ncbi:MAG: hypothetical protein ACKV2O_01345 [Acidimicrobiales bacterium]
MDGAITESVVALCAKGAAIVVSALDPSGRPAITRGWGVEVSPGGRVTVCIAASSGSPVWDSDRTRRRIAMTMVDPTNYRSAQVKGTVDIVREMNEDDRCRVAAHVGRFSELLDVVGIPGGECFLLESLLALEFTLSDGYDQTPGVNAGKALR